MKEDAIASLMKVWDSGNRINYPEKKKYSLDILQQISALFAFGPFYYYILNFETLEMEYVSEGTKDVLGLEPSEFSLHKGFEIIHPEDMEFLSVQEASAIEFLYKHTNEKERLEYKVTYMFRLKNTAGNYRTILHQAKALSLSKEGKIQYVLGIHTDITHLNFPITHEVSIINTEGKVSCIRQNIVDLFLTSSNLRTIFSNREKEIIFYMSTGLDANEIAQRMFLSPHTVNTHKKNILHKADCKNTAELITKCVKEGII